MMSLDAVREMIIEARRTEATASPFPSGVAAADDRTNFLNASEAGRCTRWLWYDKHGIAGEKHSPYGVFDRGHAFELWLTTYLAAGLARAGGRLLYTGAKQKRLMLPSFRLAGTPDGLIEWPDQAETTLEVKSHGTAQNYDSGPAEMHIRQTELNIELFHETTAHRPEDGVLVYGLVENYDRLALHRVERRPAVFIEMIGKAAAAFDAHSAATVTAEGRRHQAMRHLPLSRPLRRRPGAWHPGGRHRRPRPEDTEQDRSSHPRPSARHRSRRRGRVRPCRSGSRDHHYTDRCRCQGRQGGLVQRVAVALATEGVTPRPGIRLVSFSYF